MSTHLRNEESRPALQACLNALRPIAEYKLSTALDQRLLELGERKEYLGPEEHAELMALATFTQERTVEKLQAELAMKKLLAAFPDLNRQP